MAEYVVTFVVTADVVVEAPDWDAAAAWGDAADASQFTRGVVADVAVQAVFGPTEGLGVGRVVVNREGQEVSP